MPTHTDITYMRRALHLAARGRGATFTNPMVGAVVVASDGRILGQGWHRCWGSGHAEVNALAQVDPSIDLSGASMYVTLEPCSHYGKTPPCAKLLIDRGIGRVVVATRDPFAAVSGRGIAMLRDAGIELVEGVLEQEARSLNAAFITAHTEHRPFVTLKWARSADGYMAVLVDGRPAPVALSTPVTKTLTHRLRAENTAILTGAGTVVADNPRLDVRLWQCPFQPRRIVLDGSGRTPADAAVYSETERPTIVFSRHHRADLPLHVVQAVDPDGFSIAKILDILYREHGVTSLLVEAGADVLNQFIDSGLWDLAREEVSDIRLDSRGCIRAPHAPTSLAKTHVFNQNFYNFFTNNSLIDVKNL